MHNAGREIDMRTKKQGKSKKWEVVGNIVGVCLGVCVISGLAGIAMNAEEHSPILNKTLKDHMANGNQTAIEYYNNNYVSKGKYLYGEDEPDYLDLTTVVGFNATESGVLLHTADGGGYYIEK